MPSGGGPVYQPTTVSYEPRCGIMGGGPGGPLALLGLDSPNDGVARRHVLEIPGPQRTLLFFTLLALATGFALVGSGIADCLDVERYAAEQGRTVSDCIELPVTVTILGIVITGIGCYGMTLYLKYANWRRNCPFFNKKLTSRQQQCQSENGCGQGIMALNPSSDPLVSHTQYAPVSELPSQLLEDEERRNLMPDSKDCLSSAEESDRMLEPDPRIVLRPMGRVEDA